MFVLKNYLSKLVEVYLKEGISGVFTRFIRLIKGERLEIKVEYNSLAMPIQQKIVELNTSVVYTIVSKNYMHYALTVRESFLKKNPDSDFIIFLMDKLMSKEEVNIFNSLIENNVKIIGFDEISNNVSKTYFNEMLFKFTVLEMNTGLKPFAMEYLMNLGYEKVMYIDPDIFFYQKIDKILDKLDKYDILLTPHLLKPYNDNMKPTEIDIMMAGTYNLGFIAVKNTDNTLKMVRWWQDRLYKFGFSDIKNGMFTDQKWMELTPSLYTKVLVFKDPGHNVAYWNMHERKIEKINEKWYVNNEPLVFFHFSGLPMNNIEVISKHQNRHKLENFPMLKLLFENYIKSVQSFAPSSFGKMKYYYNYFGGSDIKIQDFLRKNYNDIFTLTSHSTIPCYKNIQLLIDYFYNEDNLVISRYAKLLYNARVDLQIAFPNIDKVETSMNSYKNWYHHEIETQEKLVQNSIQFGINLIGYFNNIIGVAQVARNFCKLSLSTSIPISVDVVDSSVHPKISEIEESFYSKYKCTDSKLDKNLIFINADVIEDYKKHYPLKFEKKKNYGIWWWEFDDYFPYSSAFDVVDEIIVFTDFIFSALKKVSPPNIKINKMPYPFIQDWGQLIEKSTLRKKYNIDKNDFLFMFSFDFLSSYERKNPVAILESFKIAFKSNTKNIKLLFKVNNSDSKNIDYDKFLEKVDKLNLNKEIILVEDALNRNEMISLINLSDVYISLHRSEGLGLGMLEAMSIGTPVIATNYGGNTEFMNNNNSCLVNYKLTKVLENFGPYQKGWKWAEPNIEHAAEYMEKLYRNEKYRLKLGVDAKKSIKEQYNSKYFTKSLYDIFN